MPCGGPPCAKREEAEGATLPEHCPLEHPFSCGVPMASIAPFTPPTPGGRHVVSTRAGAAAGAAARVLAFSLAFFVGRALSAPSCIMLQCS
jgi:hypothetical protein